MPALIFPKCLALRRNAYSRTSSWNNQFPLTRQKTMQNRDEYRHTASFYDLLFSRGLRPIRNTIHTFLTNCGAKNVIDICCGTGEQLRFLDRNTMVLTGVDLSRAMLSQARSKSPESIQYIETDATKIPLSDNSYDAVIISFALHEKPVIHHEAIFREACRVVQQNGHIIVADYCTPKNTYSSTLLGKMIIPTIERAAGQDHYRNYKAWMKQGAIEGFLKRKNPGKLTLLAPHCKECIRIYAVSLLPE